MGNHVDGEKYSFSEDYQILNIHDAKNGYYKLRSIQDQQKLIGRELQSTDEEDIFQMKCIVEEKLHNPSPFVTKLLQQKSSYEQSYCSNTHHFYLLYRQPSQRLSQQIKERKIANIPFSSFEVDLVVNRVSKGLKYLYGINHHHCKVTSDAVTWPVDSRQPVQLVDEWAIDQQSELKKMKFYRPKDEDQMQQKNEHLCSDLYYVGLIAQEMQKVGDYQNALSKHPQKTGNEENLQKKIYFLTSYRPQDRMKVFQLMSPEDGKFEPRNVASRHNHQQYPHRKQIQFKSEPEKPAIIFSQTKKTPVQIQSSNQSYVHPSTPIQQIGYQNEFSLSNKKILFSAQPIKPQTSPSPSPSPPTQAFSPNFSTNPQRPIPPSNMFLKQQSQVVFGENVGARYDNQQLHLKQKQVHHQKNVTFNSLKFNEPYNQTYSVKSLSNPQQHQKPNFIFNQQVNIPNSNPEKSDPNLLRNTGNFHAETQKKYLTSFNNPDKQEKQRFSHDEFLQKINRDIANSSVNNFFASSEKPHQQGPTVQLSNPYWRNFYDYSNESLGYSQNFISSDYKYPPSSDILNKITENQEKRMNSFDEKLLSLKLEEEKRQINAQIYSANKEDKPNIVVHKADSDAYQQTPTRRPGANPFSTIPQVSQRSQSAKSEEDREYVLEEYQNGSRYQGYKKNGMRNGRGKFHYQEGSFYDGEWKNNNMHGFGKLYYSNGTMAYEGEWFIDQFHGKGKVYNDVPTEIDGMFDFKNFDDLEEKWKYYQGTLVSDSKEGQGKLVLSNGQFYEGQFENDKVNGKGKFMTINGEIINAIWRQNKIVQIL